MKRRLLGLLASSLVLAVLLPASPASAACANPPPGRSSDAGRYKIRTHPMVVYGIIDGDLPRDAHGKYSFFLRVRRYFSGAGGTKITVTNYGDLSDLPAGYEKPGSSTKESLAFIRRFVGQPGIFFLSPDTARGRDPQARYRGQFSTTACIYNVVGTKDVTTFVPLLQQIFAGPIPLPPPQAAPTPIPRPRAVPAEAEEDRNGPITRAAGLAILVAASLWLYQSPRSPLFERWRTAQPASKS